MAKAKPTKVNEHVEKAVEEKSDGNKTVVHTDGDPLKDKMAKSTGAEGKPKKEIKLTETMVRKDY